MVFWRKKGNEGAQDREVRENKFVHHPREPEIEPCVEYDAALDKDFVDHELNETETEILGELEDVPVPSHISTMDAEEAEELRDHSKEGGWFSRMTAGLSRTSVKLGQGIADILTKRRLDRKSLGELEDMLIEADLGPSAAARVMEIFEDSRFAREVDETEVREALADRIAELLKPVVKPLEIKKPSQGPFVVLVCGVNGVGKTTTIGKLAYNYHIHQHRTVMIAAADTFRAAAVDQLEIWAARAHVPLVKKEVGADAAAVAFEAYERAKAEGVEVLMIDTAGRLHNKIGLMAELEKVVRVIKKQDETAPHAVLLVLDGTTGQNAHSQVEAFLKAVNVTGLVVTKLDGSAKGGVVVSLAEKFGIPINAIGVGEQAEDLGAFKPDDFTRALMGLGDAR